MNVEENIESDVNSKRENNSSSTNLSHILDEIRYRYELEEQRRQSLENKASILIGFLGVIVAIISLARGFVLYNILIIPFFFSVIIALGYAFSTIRLEKIKHPHKKTKNFQTYTGEEDLEPLLDEFLWNYIDATENLEDSNEEKVKKLKRSFIFTAISITYLLCVVFITFIFEIFI